MTFFKESMAWDRRVLERNYLNDAAIVCFGGIPTQLSYTFFIAVEQSSLF